MLTTLKVLAGSITVIAWAAMFYTVLCLSTGVN